MRGRGSTILYVMRRQWCGATVIRWQEMEVELRMVDCQDIESHARGSIRHLNSPRHPTTFLSTELLFPFQCVQISSGLSLVENGIVILEDFPMAIWNPEAVM